MKKIILSLTLAVTVLGAAFAAPADKEPSIIVKDAFNREFANVKDVKWETVGTEGVYEATFTFNDQSLEAYFGADGEFLGTMRQISKSLLPVLAANELAKQYPGARVVSVYEHSMANDVDYYITIYTESRGLVLKATGNGELTVYKKGKVIRATSDGK